MFWRIKNWGLVFMLAFSVTDAEEIDEIRIEPGVPLPHAEELEQIINRQLFPNKTDGQSFVELYADVVDADNDTLMKLENLEFNVLDRDGLKMMIKIGRRIEVEDIPPDTEGLAGNSSARRLGLYEDYTLIPKLFDMMKHSVYATRYRMEKTKDIRKRYHTDLNYKMGMMFGNILEIRSKAANAFKTMSAMNKERTKFIWFLVLYDRILAHHVDVTSSVNRMFALRQEKLQREKDFQEMLNQEQQESD